MSDKITAVNQVAAVATGNTVKAIFASMEIQQVHWQKHDTPYQSLQEFARRLYQLLKDEPGNIIMSPFSVSGVMAMVGLEHFWHHNTYRYDWLKVAAGAGGDTLSQVQQGMSFPR